jgi:hypothetical protein
MTGSRQLKVAMGVRPREFMELFIERMECLGKEIRD